MHASNPLFAAGLAIAICAGLPAVTSAQTLPSHDEVARSWLNDGMACNSMVEDESKTREEVIAFCQGLLTTLEQKSADPAHKPRDAFGENYYRLARFLVHSKLALLYFNADMMPNACRAAFAEMRETKAMTPSAWPNDDTRSAVDEMIRASQKTVDDCHEVYPFLDTAD